MHLCGEGGWKAGGGGYDLRRRSPCAGPPLEEAGADMLAVHTGTDQQAAGRKPIDDLITMLKARRKARIAVAGGISSQTVKDYALLGPDVVIVGSAITHAADPADEARKISQVLLQYH